MTVIEEIFKDNPDLLVTKEVATLLLMIKNGQDRIDRLEYRLNTSNNVIDKLENETLIQKKARIETAYWLGG